VLYTTRSQQYTWNEFIYYAGLRCIYFIWVVSNFVLHSSVHLLHFPRYFRTIFLCTWPVSVQSTPFSHGSKVKLWDIIPLNAQFMFHSEVASLFAWHRTPYSLLIVWNLWLSLSCRLLPYYCRYFVFIKADGTVISKADPW